MSGTAFHRDHGWSDVPIRERCRRVAAAAAGVVARTDEFLEISRSPQRKDDVETLTSELFPFCDALRYIRQQGSKVLAPREVGWLGRPLWMWGHRARVERVAHGTVLVIGTWNYPILLPGIQTAQALAAGNQVLVKPAPGTEQVTASWIACLHNSGVPTSSLCQLDPSPQSAIDAIDQGIDLVVLTGSAETGSKVAAQTAKTLTPTVMELSGCDAVVVADTADIERACDAIVFGLTINSGATCIGPRRIVATDRVADELISRLSKRLSDTSTLPIHPSAIPGVIDQLNVARDQGAVAVVGVIDPDAIRSDAAIKPVVLDQVKADMSIANSDIFAPVVSMIRIARLEQAADIVNQCNYRLGVSIFASQGEAQGLARGMDVGCVTINDMIVPTVDPRLPFGGCGRSGFGVTRGKEGLLAMTRPKVTTVRRGKWLPHLEPRNTGDRQTLKAALQLTHGGNWSSRFGGLRQLMQGSKNRQSVDQDREGTR